ncbi:2-polyprenyl-3-methyl-6-methoxy-1,4-benzoquinone monooxygenase [Inhella sp.]|uniref:2-polyprenyl-3-methyl-6-methoxy-1,4-benzoquinone monooxygenase n=1 Tax=Inhella sp. TaxID=1921806 RepID=UPI0035AE4451
MQRNLGEALGERLLMQVDGALRTLASQPAAARRSPVPAQGRPAELDVAQRQESAALMRVNHVGEVCAQALYSAQALTSRRRELAEQLRRAAQEETDHLAWTRQRIEELGGRPSLLLPLWWGGAFGLGLAAGLAGDDWSLGFVVETERQVEAHLASHLERLPAEDQASRAIVAQMKLDEAQHAEQALAAGARPLPEPVRQAMRWAAKVMTTTAHHI